MLPDRSGQGLRITRRGAVIAALAAGSLSTAQAAFPDRPLRLVVPYAPGGTTDLLARLITARLGPELGQTIVVENRSGAGGIVGCEAAARAAPDGYTLLLGNIGPIALNPSIYAQLPYDPERDFAAIGRVADFPLLLVVPSTLGVASVAELVALAKREPGRVNFASVGNGSISHLAGEMLNRAAGIRMTHVPYRGGSQAYVDLLGGQVQMLFSPGLEAVPHLQASRVRALAITSAERSQVASELPTMRELGYPDFDIVAWFGLLAPSAVPPAALTRISDALQRVMATAELRQSVLGVAAEPVVDTPEAFATLISADIRRWAPIITAAGVRIE